MGHKKKNPAPRSKQSPTVAAAPSDAVEAEPPPDISAGKFNSHRALQRGAKIEPSDSAKDVSSYSMIKLECEKALSSFRRGSYNKAIRLMKESCARHQGSALIHRVQGTLCVKVASVYEDPNLKQRFLRNAIDSARKAVELSPNSIEFSHFYANLLYEAANDAKEYEEVVQECQRALEIENPVDPAKESLQDEGQQKIPTPEARIAHVQEELKSLIQKSNIASFSTLMKNLGNGEEKFRLIPIRRIAEDPVESRLVQARRPNEIKKATKTPEERRKEIEVRVAAARLLQHKSESSPLHDEGNGNNKGLDSPLGTGQRGPERRKHGNVRKNGSTAERRDWVRSYWDSMTCDMKKDLLRVKVDDLKVHFDTSKDGQANKIITEALSFYEVNRTWRFWVCCRCYEKFVDSESHMQHVVQEHMGNVLPKMQLVLPQSIDNDWIEMLLNCSWKPLDLSAAVGMSCNQPKFRHSQLYEFHSGGVDDNEDCFKDAWDSSSEKETLGDAHSCRSIDCGSCEKNPIIGLNESEEDQVSIPFLPPDGWPISDDPERAKLLEKVHAAFELLIGHKYLAASHLNKVIQFTLDELQNLSSGSQLLTRGLDRSPICICFLGVPQLRKILKFLQDLSQSCGLSRYSERSVHDDDANGGSQGCEGADEILLDGEGSCLLLDEQLLATKSTSENYLDTASNKVPIGSSACVANGNQASSGADGFLSWIFAGPSSGEQIMSWTRMKEEKTRQGLETMQILEKEFCHLQSLCERKCEHLSYEEALQAIEDLCLEEGRKRETSADLITECYESVLRRRREKLIESDHELVFINSRFELDAITNVLKEAESLNGNQFGYEESYASVSSQLRDIESGEADEWRMEHSLNQVDTFIEVAIQKQKEQLSAELSKIDARMMRNVTGMQQLELKLGSVSAYDYQTVLVPLMKLYMRAHLEVLAEKDATEKSDAAREAFLVELARDSKKDVRGKQDNSRHMPEKSKDKKKNKDSRKSKDSKIIIGGQHQFNHDSVEERYFSYADHSESGVSAGAFGALKEQEEEYSHRSELEEEERKLEETLGYQRRIEIEAKEKQLAEQQKKSNSSISLKVAEAGYDAFMDMTDDLEVQEQEKPTSQEKLLQKNGLLRNLEGIVVNTNGALPPIKSSVVSDAGKTQHGKLQQVITNGGTTQSGLLLSEQHAGRKSRRPKVSNKLVDGKHQPSEKENIESRSSGTEGCDRQCETLQINGDVGTKTLRQLQAEEDEEERFQADLKKAVRQSLDTYQAQRRMPSSLMTFERNGLEVKRDRLQPNGVNGETQNSTQIDVFGAGLLNEVGEYNCFLNVIIQSLWHLQRFRDKFLSRSTLEHLHIGDPCVVCALYEIFTALNAAFTESRTGAVAPTSLRIALSNLYPDSNFFQEAQMNDASEVLAVIFDCLHRSFSQSSSVSDTESTESNCTCIAHSFFGMGVSEQMYCYSCERASRCMKYTSFFHNINASALRTMKGKCAKTSFDKLLNVVEMNHQLACEGCGEPKYIHHNLETPPHVFITVLGWQNTCETAEDIAATLAELNIEIDMNDGKNTYSLVSVVCYYGQHYNCFAYIHSHERWIMYDDKTIKVIGRWADVLSMCERGHLQPQVLFFEKL